MKNQIAQYPVSNNFFKVFTSFSDMYKASIQDDFSGVGVYNYVYNLDTLDTL